MPAVDLNDRLIQQIRAIDTKINEIKSNQQKLESEKKKWNSLKESCEKFQSNVSDICETLDYAENDRAKATKSFKSGYSSDSRDTNIFAGCGKHIATAKKQLEEYESTAKRFEKKVSDTLTNIQKGIEDNKSALAKQEAERRGLVEELHSRGDYTY